MPQESKKEIPEPSPWVLRFADRVFEGSRVLDLACGTGRHARLFLARGCHVTAVDRDLSGVQDLRGRLELELLEVDLEDGSLWPLGDALFDCVVVTNYLWRPLFPHLLRAVAPLGLLIYETFALGQEKIGKPQDPKFLLRPGELLNLVVTGGQLEVLACSEEEITEPKPAVVQRICARRKPG